MLDRLRGWMAPGAHLVACVPNIAHWSALAEVMAGRWLVASAGLFDRTHRRFFTQDSLLALLRAQSFRPIRCRPRNFGGVEAERVIAALTSAAVSLGEDAAGLRARALALQCIIVAEHAQDPALQRRAADDGKDVCGINVLSALSSRAFHKQMWCSCRWKNGLRNRARATEMGRGRLARLCSHRLAGGLRGDGPRRCDGNDRREPG